MWKEKDLHTKTPWLCDLMLDNQRLFPRNQITRTRGFFSAYNERLLYHLKCFLKQNKTLWLSDFGSSENVCVHVFLGSSRRCCSVLLHDLSKVMQLRRTQLEQFLKSVCPCHRLNDAPVRGYENDVGNKTTMRFFYPESASYNPGLHNEPGTLMVLVPFKQQDLRWLKEILYNEKRVQDVCENALSHTPTHTHFISMSHTLSPSLPHINTVLLASFPALATHPFQTQILKRFSFTDATDLLS